MDILPAIPDAEQFHQLLYGARSRTGVQETMPKEDTPFPFLLEMGFVLYGAPVFILLSAVGLVAFLRPWRFSSPGHGAIKFTAIVGILIVAAACSWAAFLIGFGTLLEHPRYRLHVVCDPCF